MRSSIGLLIVSMLFLWQGAQAQNVCSHSVYRGRLTKDPVTINMVANFNGKKPLCEYTGRISLSNDDDKNVLLFTWNFNVEDKNKVEATILPFKFSCQANPGLANDALINNSIKSGYKFKDNLGQSPWYAVKIKKEAITEITTFEITVPIVFESLREGDLTPKLRSINDKSGALSVKIEGKEFKVRVTLEPPAKPKKKDKDKDKDKDEEADANNDQGGGVQPLSAEELAEQEKNDKAKKKGEWRKVLDEEWKPLAKKWNDQKLNSKEINKYKADAAYLAIQIKDPDATSQQAAIVVSKAGTEKGKLDTKKNNNRELINQINAFIKKADSFHGFRFNNPINVAQQHKTAIESENDKLEPIIKILFDVERDPRVAKMRNAAITRIKKAYTDKFENLDKQIIDIKNEVANLKDDVLATTRDLSNEKKISENTKSDLRTSFEDLTKEYEAKKEEFRVQEKEYEESREGEVNQGLGVQVHIEGIRDKRDRIRKNLSDDEVINIELENIGNEVEDWIKLESSTWEKWGSKVLIAVFFFLLIAIPGFIYLKKRVKTNKEKSKVKFVYEEAQPTTSTASTSTATPTQTMATDEAVPGASQADDVEIEMDMEIIEEDASGAAQPAAALLANDKDFITLPLNDIWEDSAVAEVKIHRQACLEMYYFSEESLLMKPAPEVGGFLLGSHQEREDGQYRIFVEEFLKSENVEYQNNYELSFGAQSQIELDNARFDAHGNERIGLVGWFHTHPGHTPFLSHTDIKMHTGMFPFNYQVAIVLDPNTINFDTGIFTRKRNKQLNNKDGLKEYFKWEAIKNSAIKIGGTNPATATATAATQEEDPLVKNYFLIEGQLDDGSRRRLGYSRKFILKLRQLVDVGVADKYFALKQHEFGNGEILLDDIEEVESAGRIMPEQSTVGALKIATEFDGDDFVDLRIPANHQVAVIYDQQKEVLTIQLEGATAYDAQETPLTEMIRWTRSKF